MTKHDNEGIMKATEFVKWFGWNITKYNLKYHLNESEKLVYMDWILSVEDVDDLKRLVESHELLKIIDLESPLIDELVNELIETGRPRLVELGKRIKQAIADVEACQ